MSRPTARRSGRSTTAGSCSTASRSPWSSPRRRRWRASPRRWSGWSTTAEPHATDICRQRDRGFAGEGSDEPLRGAVHPAEAARRCPARRSPPPPSATRANILLPIEHHNPMELYATTAIVGKDGQLTVYDKTQGVQNVQRYLCSVFGLQPEELRVMSPFVGGAFGAALRPQYQVVLAVLAARALRALGAPRADAAADVCAGPPPRDDPAHRAWARMPTARWRRSPMMRSA